MAHVTLQVIDGFEKGRVFSELETPITLGREEDNHIQLNDERVSRFHAKIQEDGGRVILTDLESTNGTRVNGHPVQMRVLQLGDVVSVGRSLLLFGSADQISAKMPRATSDSNSDLDSDDFTVALPDSMKKSSDSLTPLRNVMSASAVNPDDPRPELFPNGPPELPTELRTVQAAQLSDLLAYVHQQIAVVTDAALEEPATKKKPAEMRLDWETWQRLMKLEMQLAIYVRGISDPGL